MITSLDSDSENEEDNDSKWDEETQTIMHEILNLKSQLSNYPKLSELKSKVNYESWKQPKNTPIIQEQQEIQLNIWKILHIEKQINNYKLQLVIKFMPKEIWNKYYDSSKQKISKTTENFYKLPIDSQISDYV